MRHRQWETRLGALIAKKLHAPYEWGRNDCLLFAADVAKAVTGKDHAKGHRGKYKSFASAYAYLKNELGHESAEALLDSLFEQKPVGFAQRGDLVMASEGIPSLCMGAFALGVAENGIVKIPRSAWTKAWAL